MPPVNQRSGVVAFARQTDLGTPADDPTYALPITGGGIASKRDRATLPTTRASSARSGTYIQRAWGGGTQNILAYEEPIGLLISSCMGVEDVASIGGGLSKHQFTMQEQWTDDPLTFWSLVGDEWEVFSDCYVTKIVIAGTSGENVTLAFDILSLSPLGPMSGLVSGDPVPDYTLVEDEPREKYIGSDFWIEADAAPPVSASVMENFELSIDRTPAIKHGQFLYPKLLTPKRDIDFSCTVIYDDAEQGWDFYHASQQGDADGQAPDQNLVAGSFAVFCGRHPDDEPNAGLKLYCGPPVATVPTNIATTNWEYVCERPEANPTPDSLQMEVGGPVIDPGDGDSEITVELINTLATEY